jgi:hypothetical protein
MLTVHILGREIVAIRWRDQPPAPIVATPAPATPADPATNGSGLGGTFERGPAATALGNAFGFKLEER